MHRAWTGVRAAGLGLLLFLPLFGCNDKGETFNPPPGAPGGVGLVANVPPIAGDWVAEATVTSNSCGSLFDVPPDELELRIDQADTAVDIDIVTPCDGNIGRASGTLNPSNVLSITTRRTRVVSQHCTLEIKTTLDALANNLGDEISGSLKVEATPTPAPSTDCGTGFPCSYEQKVMARPCPDSGCVLGACPTRAAP